MHMRWLHSESKKLIFNSFENDTEGLTLICKYCKKYSIQHLCVYHFFKNIYHRTCMERTARLAPYPTSLLMTQSWSLESKNALLWIFPWIVSTSYNSNFKSGLDYFPLYQRLTCFSPFYSNSKRFKILGTRPHFRE